MTAAYAENAERFDAEDLGDNNTTFGVSVVHNLRHLLEGQIEGIEGVLARRAMNSFWLEIDGRPLYLYKAPPGRTSVDGMRFDESELRLQILKDNAQLQLDIDGVQDDPLAAISSPTLHPVITHFGSPEAGFTHATVGAPSETPAGTCEWDWIEAFEETAAAAQTGEQSDEAVAAETEVDFDLRIRTARPMTERVAMTKGARAALGAHVNAEPERETGGILLGYRVHDRTVCITEVSPPGPRALMRPRFFRRDTRFLQRWLNRRYAVSGGRDDYLGEWHVHHAIDAAPSCVDKRELWRIAKKKNYPTDAPVLLIVEDTPEERRLRFYLFTLKPKRWRPIDGQSA